MHKLAVRQRQQEYEHDGQVHDEQQSHHRAVTEHEQRKSGQAREEEQREEYVIEASTLFMTERRIPGLSERG